MSDQHASVEDEIERALRLGLATASQMADRYARARQDFARQAQDRSEQEARQLEARYRADGASATARLALVDRTEWWDRAAPAEIASMWQLAQQWQDEHPRAAVAAETIARQVRDRYGLDVHAAASDAKAIHAAVARLNGRQADGEGRAGNLDDTATAVAAVLRAEQRDAASTQAADDPQQLTAAPEGHDADRAALLDLEAEQYDQQAADGGTGSLSPEELQALAADARAQAVQRRSEVAAAVTSDAPASSSSWDSVERRDQTAASLVEAGLSAEAVAVAMRADVAHARPAKEAGAARATAGRNSGVRAAARVAHRPDRGR